MEQLLKNKVIVISGGNGRLGKESVRAVGENGGIAVVTDIINPKSKSAFEQNSGFIKMDVTSNDSIRKAIESIVKKHKKIDAIINCAYPKNKKFGAKFEDVTYRDFCENINLHLGGYFLVSQQFAQFFKKQGYGNIVNIGSIYGVIAPRFEIYEKTGMGMPVEYSMIKSAIVMLTKYMAKYYKGSGIRFNCISLGGLLDKQPKKFILKYKGYCLTKGMLSPNDIKGTLVYLLSDISSYVNGQNIVVDDGFTL